MASLLEDLYARKAIELGKFTLKSGQISSIYLDLRLMAQVPKTLVSSTTRKSIFKNRFKIFRRKLQMNFASQSSNRASNLTT